MCDAVTYVDLDSMSLPPTKARRSGAGHRRIRGRLMLIVAGGILGLGVGAVVGATIGYKLGVTLTFGWVCRQLAPAEATS